MGYPRARTLVPVSIWSFVGKSDPFSTILFSKFFRRISFLIFLPVAICVSSVLTKFHLFENSVGLVAGSSNFGTRLNMVVCRQKWLFSTILFSKFSRRISFIIFLPVALYMSSILINFHVFEDSLAGVSRSSNLGTPTANEEHEPFVVYETFLKNFPTNFF